MTIDERNAKIVELIEARRKKFDDATPTERKRMARELLVGTGMYTKKDGKLKKEFQSNKSKQQAAS